MQLQALRPVAAALALALAAGLAPTVASAQQQVFGQWSTQNGRYQHSITGTVTYFNQFDLRIFAGNYGNGYGNGRAHRHHRDNENDQNSNDGRDGNGGNNNGQYPNADQYPNSDQYPNGGYDNGYPNGGYPNGGNNDGRGNRNDRRIHLHRGTVINPRGAYLQNGMQLRITGHPNQDGSFEADRIDVLNGQGGYRRQ